MALKHIARYKAMENGTSIEEELAWLKAKSQINYELAFLDEWNAYEKYKWQKESKKEGNDAYKSK